ncbi:MDR family MFS transporter [Devriesea agamarum]|uniref:MDR family MFS transporter n=1 Tax=Devriesea agamarum TaxID=472569 RepID=UPI000AB05038|nr:MDR family MFS transporter [Devriesea agamarum]
MSTTMTSTRPSPKDPPNTAPGELSHRQVLTILVGLLLGMFLASLDQTIVTTAIRTIADDLHGLDIQAWVTTAYLITSTIATPLYGKLSDIYGRKGFFLFAIAVFIVGSLLCTIASSMYMLAAFRAIQGIGAGGLFSLALAIIGDIVAPRERAKYQGYFLAVFGTSSVLGPVIGGFFAGQSSILGVTGWRWVFLVNVPIGILALIVVSRTLRLHHVRQQRTIDWWGAASIIIALVPLLVVAEQGRTWGWDSTRSIAAFVIGGIGIILFILSEWRAGENALIPLRLFRLRSISVTIVASLIIGFAMFGAMTMLPLYFQIVHGADPMDSGLMMLPMVVGMMFSSIISGQLISKTGAIRIFPLIGTLLLTTGLVLLSTITADTQLWHVLLMTPIIGLGLGLCMQPLTLIVQSVAAPQEIGVATSSATFFRQMGGTAGVAVFLSVLFSTVAGSMKDALVTAAHTPSFSQALRQVATDTNLRTTDPSQWDIVQALLDPAHHASGLDAISKDSAVLTRMPAALAHPFEVGFATSMDHVFFVAAGVALIGFIVLLFLPKIELRTTSAAAALREQTEPIGEGLAALATAEPVNRTVHAHRADTRGFGRHSSSHPEPSHPDGTHPDGSHPDHSHPKTASGPIARVEGAELQGATVQAGSPDLASAGQHANGDNSVVSDHPISESSASDTLPRHRQTHRRETQRGQHDD